MGIFSLPGLGQNYTFFGVNPSTGFADTFYKAQANKRANDAAYAAKKKDDGMDDYLKNVYLKNTNILPIYADKVKGEVAAWIASTNELKSKYGTGYQNSTPFVTSYMDLITKLNNYQQSSKAISDNLNDANKNPDKFVFKQDYNDALQKNDFNRLAELTGNPNAIYNNGMALDPAYDPLKAANDINGVFKNSDVEIQNRKMVGNGIMSYDNVTLSNKSKPEFEMAARQYFANNRAAQVAHNGDVNSFLDEVYKISPGNTAAEKQMNISKGNTAPSNTFGGGYFNNGKVAVTVSDGNTIAFEPTWDVPQNIIDALKKERNITGAKNYRDGLIKRGYKPEEVDAVMKGSQRSLTRPEGFSWKINKLYNIAFNQGDPKSQNFQTLSGGTVINALTGEEEKVKDVSGTVQGVAERELEDGKKEYYAIIKGRDTEKNGVIISGKTTYVKYDKNIASQIAGMTTDKDMSAFDLYKDGTISGGENKATQKQKELPLPKNKDGKVNKSSLQPGIIYYDGSTKMLFDGNTFKPVK